PLAALVPDGVRDVDGDGEGATCPGGEGSVAEPHPHLAFEDVDRLVVLGVDVRRDAERLPAELGDRQIHPRSGPVLLDDDLQGPEAKPLSVFRTEVHGGNDGAGLAHGALLRVGTGSYAWGAWRSSPEGTRRDPRRIPVPQDVRATASARCLANVPGSMFAP